MAAEPTPAISATSTTCRTGTCHIGSTLGRPSGGHPSGLCAVRQHEAEYHERPGHNDQSHPDRLHVSSRTCHFGMHCLSPIFPGSYRPFPPIETAAWGGRMFQVQEAGQTALLTHFPNHTEGVSHFYVIKRQQVTRCEKWSWRVDLEGREGLRWGGWPARLSQETQLVSC